ncbi:MAG: hypothetical protein WCI73_09705 [Phycisphaerae bacterium]
MAVQKSGANKSKDKSGKPKAKNGALIGWMVSGAILLGVLVAVGLVVLRRMTVDIGPPTLATSGPGCLDLIKLDLDASKVTDVPSGSGAEKLYKEAIIAALDGKDVYEFIQRERECQDRLNEPRFQKVTAYLLQAADMGLDPKIEIVFPELSIKGNRDLAVQGFMKALGHLLTNSANEVALTVKDPAAQATVTRKYSRAALIYGSRMWTQGVYAAYRYAGLSVSGDALMQYQMYKIAPDKLAAVQELDAARKAAGLKWFNKNNCSQRWDGKAEPGDLANLALHDQDRSWRLQGIMWFGVVQWTNAGPEKRVVIQKLLQKLTLDPDKYISEQAKLALDTPRGDVQELGNQIGL